MSIQQMLFGRKGSTVPEPSPTPLPVTPSPTPIPVTNPLMSNKGSMGSSKSATTSLTMVQPLSSGAIVGDFIVASIAMEATVFAVGSFNEIESVVDSKGNTWVRRADYTHSTDFSGYKDHRAASFNVWTCHVTNAINSGDTVTFTFNSEKKYKVASIHKFGTNAGLTPTLEYSTIDADASVTMSGLSDNNYLFLHLYATSSYMNPATINLNGTEVTMACQSQGIGAPDSYTANDGITFLGKFNLISSTSSSSGLGGTSSPVSVGLAFKQSSPPPTPTPTSSNTPTPTPTPSVTATQTPTPSMPPTPDASTTATPTPTPTPSTTATATPTPTPTSTPIPSPSPTPSPLPTGPTLHSASVTTSTSASIAKPAGLVAGDLIFITISARAGYGAPAYNPTDGSFILAGSINAGDSWNTDQTKVYYKIAGGSEPASYAISSSGASVAAFRVTNANAVTTVVTKYNTTGGSTTSPSSTLTAGRLLIGCSGGMNPMNGNASATMTRMYNMDNGTSSAAGFYETVATSGSATRTYGGYVSGGNARVVQFEVYAAPPALTNKGNIGSVSLKTATTTVNRAPTVACAAGSVVMVAIGANNKTTTNGDNSEVVSVTDAQGNTYIKAGEYTYAAGGVNNGTVTSLWYSKLTKALTTSNQITATFATSNDRKCMSLWNFNITSGHTPTVVDVKGVGNASGVVIPSMTTSTLPSGSYLAFRASTLETDSNANWDGTSTWTPMTHATTSWSGSSTDEVALRGEWKLFEGTSVTSNPWNTSGMDASNILITFKAS